MKVIFAILIEHNLTRTYGEWRYSSITFDLNSRFRRVVSFMPFRFKPKEGAPPPPTHLQPPDRKLGGRQSRSGRCREDNGELEPEICYPLSPRNGKN
jgi:hypothetical protein